MDYLKPVQSELKKQISSLEDYIDIEMHANEKWIRESIKDRWDLGKRPDGSIIGLYRSEEYARDKYNKSNSAGFGNVDLTLTGSLWRGIQISGFNGEYEVFSTDSKYEDIADKYGYYNFNLSEEERNFLFDKILVTILNRVINKTYEQI